MRRRLSAQLLRNLESACIKARRYGLAPGKIISFLRKQTFATTGSEAKLSRPSCYPIELGSLLRDLFDGLYEDGVPYRSTGVILFDLAPDHLVQYSLFEDLLRADKVRSLYEAADTLGGKYGKHTLHLGASHPLEVRGKGRRGVPTVRQQTRLRGETARRHLGMPLFHGDVR